MNEILPREEIDSHFDSEWVLVEDPEGNEHLEVLRGKVDLAQQGSRRGLSEGNRVTPEVCGDTVHRHDP
jgi:hypothetical protein